MKLPLLHSATLVIALSGAAMCVGESAVNSDLRRTALAELHEVLQTQQRWVKVHAAESLLQLSFDTAVDRVFQEEARVRGGEPEYRIGIWRVMAQAATRQRDREQWIDRIKQVFLNEEAPDRVHAAETLAKLKAPLTHDETSYVIGVADRQNGPIGLYCRWWLAVTDAQNQLMHQEALWRDVGACEASTRRIAAYALRHLGTASEEKWSRLSILASREPDEATRLRLLGTALITAPASITRPNLLRIRRQISQLRSIDDAKLQYELCQVYAEKATPDDLSTLVSNLNYSPVTPTSDSAAADVRAAAATAILRLDRRNRHFVHVIDWAVIALYMIGMILVGLYYARRNKSRDDYFLGGRTMKPWAVGVSLFATIISTLSYLAYPGELIRYGPMLFVGAISFPLIYYVVGWWLIPSFMGLNVTSGYEILEQKLGVGARLLGATLFLLLRLLWMATIIYATTTVALLPVLGMDPAYAPYICLFIGCITLAYTSIGGLRAVVMTDVIQSCILFGGAILTIVLISIHFGGLQWLPRSWPAHWTQPVWGFGLQNRITVANAILWTFTWYVCTAGSDQMAIQRYLATSDLAAARRSFGVTMIASFLVKVVLGIVGLAVMAYFIDQPQMLADRTSVLSNADELFSRYILVGLPAGMSGLVIAGMMAAAMSSMSSGINASSSVVCEDFIKRFRSTQSAENNSVSDMRWVSGIIGAVVVLLSLGVGYVPGNLFEVTMRVVNALVAPLFVLFFLAIFVPWATPTGAVLGVGASLVVSIAIAFVPALKISFMWVIPASLCVGVLVGVILSWRPRQIPS